MPSQSSHPRTAAAAGRSGRRASGPGLLGLLRHLTVRDRFLLRALADHHVLTTNQIAELAFGALRTAQARLAALHRLGLLDRFRGYAVYGSEQWRYVLAPLGAAIVAYERGKKPPPSAKVRARNDALAVNQRLDHLLGVNGFHTSLAAAARFSHTANDSECVLVEWLSEHHCGQRYGDLIRADAYGRWRAGSREVEYFLEYDTGTETLGRVAAKLAGYGDLAIALDRPVLVLFWLPGARRESNTRRVLEPACPAGVYPATAVPVLGTPAEPVWLPLGSTERVRLADLPTSTLHQAADDG